MTPDLDEFARLAWVQLWQVTVVALVIGAVVRLCCRDRPRLAYALWMLVVVKSIVPPVWSSPTGLFSWARVGGAAARRDVAGEPPGLLMAPPATAPAGGAPTRAANGLEGGADRDRGMDWARFRFALFSIWSAGLVLCTAFVLGKQFVCSNLIRRSSLPVDERYVSALADLSRRLGVRRDVRLIVTSRPIGPAVFGLVRPSILLPEPLLSGTPPEQVELVLAHELIHVRRGDVLVGKLAARRATDLVVPPLGLVGEPRGLPRAGALLRRGSRLGRRLQARALCADPVERPRTEEAVAVARRHPGRAGLGGHFTSFGVHHEVRKHRSPAGFPDLSTRLCGGTACCSFPERA